MEIPSNPAVSATLMVAVWLSVCIAIPVVCWVVSRRLGHATVSITLDIYSHCMPTADGEAAAKVAGLILGS